MEAFFDFEKPIATLEKKLQDLRDLAKAEGVDLSREIASLEKKLILLIDDTYSKLNPWQRVLISRHSNRPYTRITSMLFFPPSWKSRGIAASGKIPPF